MGRLRPLNKAINRLLVHRQKVAQIGQNLGPGMVYKQGAAGNDPVFQQEFTHTLNGALGDPLFVSRASVASHTSFEGIVRPTLSGEMRFDGARRVENLIPTNNNSAGDGAIKAAGNTYEYNQPDAFGGNTAVKITGPGSTLVDYYFQLFNPGNNRKIRASIWMKVVSMPTTLSVYTGADISDHLSAELSGLPLNTWVRVAAPARDAIAGNAVRYGISGLSVPAFEIHFCAMQYEDVTSQFNDAPSEFVSVGLGDDHGSNADGVKYFNTENRNEVVSDVVAEVAGPVLSYGLLRGIRIDGPMTNLQTNSEAGQANFVPLGGTLDTGVKATPLGFRANCSTTIDGTSSIHGVFCTNHLGGFVTVTANLETATSVYIKSPLRYIGVANGVNLPGQKGTFDTVNKTWHNLGTDVAGATAWEVAEGFWRLSIVWTNAATTLVGIYAATGDSNDVFVSSTIAGSPVVTAVGAQIAQAGVQDVTTSYLPSDGTAATSRLLDQVRYSPPPEWVADLEAYGVLFDMWNDCDFTDLSVNGAFYAVGVGSGTDGRADFYMQGNDQEMRAQILHQNFGYFFDLTADKVLPLHEHSRYGFRFDYNKFSPQRMAWFKNGAGPLNTSTNARTGDYTGITTIYIGVSSAGTSPLRSSIKNLRMYVAPLSDGKMKAETWQ